MARIETKWAGGESGVQMGLDGPTLGGMGMLTYSFLLILLRCWGTGIWAVATEEPLSLSDTFWK